MAKIKDSFNPEVVDLYQEHAFHQRYHSDCSSCFKEETMAKAQRIVARKKLTPHQEVVQRHPALNNPYGSNYPTGYVPE